MDIKIDKFEGPFELLYHLIEKNKIEITDIPIAFITDKFILHVDEMKKNGNNDMDYISEFIVMIATLLEIKSKMLLPVKEVNEQGIEIDPREELVSRLIEYKRAKSVAILLKEQSIYGSFSRLPEKTVISSFKKYDGENIDKTLGDLSLYELKNIFETVVLRSKQRVDLVRKDFNSVKKDEFTVKDKENLILKKVSSNKNVTFISLFDENSSKSEKITTFLAVLELIKVRLVTVVQLSIFDEIIINGVNNYDETN